MVRDKYEQILDRFESRYPYFYEQAIDWWSSGRVSIGVRLSDNTVIDYDDINNTIRYVNLNEDDVDDEARRRAFGCNLHKFIITSGMTKGEVAERLGITNAMLSRYLYGKAMPSFDKGRQIAKLMGCAMEELFDETYVE